MRVAPPTGGASRWRLVPGWRSRRGAATVGCRARIRMVHAPAPIPVRPCGTRHTSSERFAGFILRALQPRGVDLPPARRVSDRHLAVLHAIRIGKEQPFLPRVVVRPSIDSSRYLSALGIAASRCIVQIVTIDRLAECGVLGSPASAAIHRGRVGAQLARLAAQRPDHRPARQLAAQVPDGGVGAAQIGAGELVFLLVDEAERLLEILQLRAERMRRSARGSSPS